MATEQPVVPHDRDALDKAMKSVAAAAKMVEGDTNRPAFHFLPPANWMNDPNGPIYHDGWYHMFYQHNPYGDQWGHMHWGHARSRDLLAWEHQPIALWPSLEADEEHVFSGSATINSLGEPMIFYTSIFKGKSASDYAEQWAAIGDSSLTTWKKHPANPILKQSIHGGTNVWDWRDPFLFKYKDDDYMVLGGNLNKAQGGAAVVTLYKAEDPALTKWKYLGILFTHPDDAVKNIECPNFFELNGKWVLIISPHGKVQYFVGDFDGRKFSFEKRGLLDHSDNFYAPNSTVDNKGRRILWGWVRGFREGQGWNGCLTLPRVLTVGDRVQLWQIPAAETHALRGAPVVTQSVKLGRGRTVSIPLPARRAVVHASFWSGEKSGLRLYGEGKSEGIKIFYSGGELKVGNITAELALHPVDPFSVEVFVDGPVVEVYANGKACVTTLFYSEGKLGAEFYSEADNTLAELKVFAVKEPTLSAKE